MNILIGLCANIALDNSDISLSSVSTFFRIAPLLCCPFPTSHNFFSTATIYKISKYIDCELNNNKSDWLLYSQLKKSLHVQLVTVYKYKVNTHSVYRKIIIQNKKGIFSLRKIVR